MPATRSLTTVASSRRTLGAALGLVLVVAAAPFLRSASAAQPTGDATAEAGRMLREKKLDVLRVDLVLDAREHATPERCAPLDLADEERDRGEERLRPDTPGEVIGR